MAEQVGELFYSVTLDTGEMVAQQRKVDGEIRKTTASLDGFRAKLTQVASAVAAYASAAYLIGRSDAYTKLSAQLKLATENASEFAGAMARVKSIAQEAQTDLSGVAVLYARINTATKEMGKTQAEVSDITRAVALSLKVSGATASESAAATLQLSQAFASGVLRGDEFNSVNEAAPRLMRALADGIGVPVGALREMAAEGKITSEIMANALPKALKELEEEAKNIQTIGGAFQELRNELTLFIGEQANANGAVKLTTAAIATLAANIDLLAAAALGFATAKISKVLIETSIQAAASAQAFMGTVAAQQAARAAAIEETAAKVQQIAATQAGIVAARADATAKLAAANATIAQAQAQAQAAKSAGALSVALAAVREAELLAAAATNARNAALAELAVLGQQQMRITAAMTAAQTAQTAALAGTSTAATLASRALGLLGGPIGLITMLLGLGVTAWAAWGSAARDNEAKATESVERSTDEIVASLDKQIAKLKERNTLANAGMAGEAKKDTEAAKKMATLLGQINDLRAGKGINGGAALPEVARLALLQDLTRQYGVLAGKVGEVNDEQTKLNNAGEKTAKEKWLEKYATDAEKLAAEIAKAKKELGSEFTPEIEQRIRQKFVKKTPKTPDEKFDDAAYLSDLRKAQATEMGVINETEAEKLRVAKANLDAKKISEATYQQAVTLITEAAEKDRAALMLKTQQDIDRERLSAERKAARERADIEANRKDARRDIAAVDPIAAIQQEEAEKLAAVQAAQQLDLANAQLYEDQKTAIHQLAAQKRNEVLERELNQQNRANQASLSAMSDLAGNVYSLLEKAGKERSALGKAAFLAQKAISVAEIIMNTEVAAAKAMGQFGPYGIPVATMIRAAGYASAGVVAGLAVADVAGGRQYGGPVSSGSLYRVNETGAPEMFTGSNGSQFMLPTKSGRVTPADEVGGGGSVTWQIIVNNNAPGAAATASVDQQARIVTVAVNEVASQISNNTGPVATALRSTTNVRPRL